MKRLLTLTLAIALCVAPLVSAEFFDSDGVNIYYEIVGEGEPVVLIHGFSASGATNFGSAGIIGKLAAQNQVITIDCRGHGKSDKPHGAENYGMKMVQDVVNLLDHLNIEKTHVAGYSMGAFITTKFITEHPDRVLSAVPGGAGWSTVDDGGAETRDLIAKGLENGEGLTPLMRALTPAGDPPMPQAQLDAMNAAVTGMNDVLALAACIRGMDQLMVPQAKLEANTVPTMVVIGERDPLKLGVDAMAGVMANMAVTVVEGGDHMTTVGSPVYHDALTSFIAHHGANGSDEGSDTKEGSEPKEGSDSKTAPADTR